MSYITASLSDRGVEDFAYLSNKINEEAKTHVLIFYSKDRDNGSYEYTFSTDLLDEPLPALIRDRTQYVALDIDRGHICFYDKNKSFLYDLLIRSTTHMEKFKSYEPINHDFEIPKFD